MASKNSFHRIRVMNGKGKYLGKQPITKETRKAIKRKHRLWARYVETKDLKIEKEFKKLRICYSERVPKTTGERAAGGS